MNDGRRSQNMYLTHTCIINILDFKYKVSYSFYKSLVLKKEIGSRCLRNYKNNFYIKKWYDYYFKKY